MTNETPQHKHKTALLVCLIIVAILVGLNVVLGSAVYQDFIEAEVGGMEIASNLAKERSLGSLEDLAAQAVLNKQPIVGYVITEEDLPRFVDLIEEIGSKKGADVSVASLAELGGVNNKKEVVKGWKIELRLEGTFDQVWGGLELIEALPAVKKINRVNLVRTSAPTDSGIIRWGGGVEIELPTI